MKNAVSWLRRQSTIILFLALGVAMLYGQPILQAVTEWAHDVPEAPSTAVRAMAEFGDPQAKAVVENWHSEMSGAELTAQAQASGWVAAGNAGSKFIVAAGYFFLFLFLVWIAQGITAPSLKKWAKDKYTREFIHLDGYDRFRVYQAQRWQLVLLACAAILAAALIQ